VVDIGVIMLVAIIKMLFGGRGTISVEIFGIERLFNSERNPCSEETNQNFDKLVDASYISESV